ncbi:MAG: hypothetical protein OXD36_08515 [Rhodobacter sp.]|nr:hypothetical protein [Rhodobacter sp.]MCY4241770.1 hypothetical protein [Rhodobacter sp.]
MASIHDIHGLTGTVSEGAGYIQRDLEASSGVIDLRIEEISENPLSGSDSPEALSQNIGDYNLC